MFKAMIHDMLRQLIIFQLTNNSTLQWNMKAHHCLLDSPLF